MPRVLTLTQKPEESTEEFAARLAGQVQTFFGESPGDTSKSTEDTSKSTQPPPGTEDGSAPQPTDVTAPSEQPSNEDMSASLRELFAEFGRGPGWVTNPKGTKKLHDYWIHGKGAGKIRWGQSGDFDRCVREVGSEIGESDPGKLRFIKQICAQWHKDATGATPGHAPAEGG
jgi:hypothetical protein